MTVIALPVAQRVSTEPPRTLVGFGLAELGAWDPGRLMMGWVDPENRANEVAEPLACRAMAIESDGRTVFHVTVELCFVSVALRRAVLARVLAFLPTALEQDVMLTATHNHSGPGGFSDALLYDFSSGGFRHELTARLADDIALAIRRAHEARVPARLSHHRGEVPATRPIAFNRRLHAHNRNRDVVPVVSDRAHLAVDRDIDVLWAETYAGVPLGVLSWWGLHGTTIHGDNQAIRPDHKGLASRMLEAEVGVPGFVAIFAQGAAGDVSPNFRWDPVRGRDVGWGEDDLTARREVALVQVRCVQDALKRRGEPLGGPVGGRIIWIEAEGEEIDPRWTGGRRGCRLEAPSIGAAVVRGTSEGAGLDLPEAPWAAWEAMVDASSVLRERMPESLRGRLREHAPWPRLPARHFGSAPMRFLEQAVVQFMAVQKAAAGPDVDGLRALLRGASEVAPRRVPVQLLSLGGLHVVGLPIEPTTQVGRRVRRAAAECLGPRVVVNGYANGYAGYGTTEEEFEAQAYEGASTLFGRWTSAALCASVHTLASRQQVHEHEATVVVLPGVSMSTASFRVQSGA